MAETEVTVAREWITRHLQPVRWRGDEAELRCPLPGHDDANPSATANAAKRAWKCHGCDNGGKLSELAERLGDRARLPTMATAPS